MEEMWKGKKGKTEKKKNKYTTNKGETKEPQAR